jgi:RNA polymerase sigma-70 factor (ECF subfamily)
MADSVVSLAAVQGNLTSTVLTAEDFDELVRRNQKRIFRMLMALLRDEDAADTLTQECFLRAYKRRDSFRGESSVDTWLYRIAINLARDHQRSKREGFWKRMFSTTSDGEEEVSVLDTVADAGSGAEAHLLAREEVEQVWWTVRRLSDKQREVFVLRFAEDMGLEEIGQTLEMNVGTVKSHLNRALTSVRKRLEEHRRGQ